MNNPVTRQQFDTLRFHPETLRFNIFSRFNKIAEANRAENIETQDQMDEIENILNYSPFATMDNFVSSLKDINSLISTAPTLNTSDQIKDIANDILNKSLSQINKIYDLFKLRNFGSNQIDYYEILNQIDLFLNMFLSEHQKDNNLINYDILNADLKTNYILQKILGIRTGNLKNIVYIIQTESDKENHFVFSQDEINIIRGANIENLNILNQSRSYLNQNIFSDMPVGLLTNIYNLQDKIFISTDYMGAENPVSAKSAIKLKSKSNTVLNNSNIEFFKYQKSDEINFNLFNSRFKEYLETEQALFSFK